MCVVTPQEPKRETTGAGFRDRVDKIGSGGKPGLLGADEQVSNQQRCSLGWTLLLDAQDQQAETVSPLQADRSNGDA